MSDDPFAPARQDGQKPYVVEKRSWGRSYRRIEYAASLKEARRYFGWTREMHTRVSVRRARVSDIASEVPHDS